MCNTSDDCEQDYLTLSYDGWTDTANYGGVYGLARDGHVIYGPYNGDGELWNCDDHDVCNGFYLDDGSYGYASTLTFPYVVGCWGPGPAQTYAADCTENGCSGSTYAGYEDTSDDTEDDDTTDENTDDTTDVTEEEEVTEEDDSSNAIMMMASGVIGLFSTTILF